MTADPEPAELLPTRASLLERIRNPDDAEGWLEFHDTYRRLILGVARKSGLNDAEADDAAQETLIAVARHIGSFRYDAARCSFKSWLMLIVRQRIIWQLRRREPTFDGQAWVAPAPVSAQHEPDTTRRTATVERVEEPGGVQLDQLYETEWRQTLLSAALETVRRQVNPRQFQIFELVTIQEWAVRDVARTLRVTAPQVYLARHRVGAAVQRELRRLAREG